MIIIIWRRYTHGLRRLRQLSSGLGIPATLHIQARSYHYMSRAILNFAPIFFIVCFRVSLLCYSKFRISPSDDFSPECAEMPVTEPSATFVMDTGGANVKAGQLCNSLKVCILIYLAQNQSQPFWESDQVTQTRRHTTGWHIKLFPNSRFRAGMSFTLDKSCTGEVHLYCIV